MTPIATSRIAAHAMTALEMSPISSYGDDSEQAILAAALYPDALGFCIERGEWSFASRLERPAEVAEDALDPDLSRVYQRPSNYVKMLRVWPEDARWRMDADRLRADQPLELIRFAFTPVDEDRMSSAFRLAVGFKLAALMAPRWTASMNRAAGLHDDADAALEQALRGDRGEASGERYDGRDRADDWASAAIR